MKNVKAGCRITHFGEVATFQGERLTSLGDKMIIYRQAGNEKEDLAHRFEHAKTCACDVTVTAGTPTPCAWCEDETGIRTQGSHGICERHSKAAIDRYMTTRLALQEALQ